MCLGRQIVQFVEVMNLIRVYLISFFLGKTEPASPGSHSQHNCTIQPAMQTRAPPEGGTTGQEFKH